jgi:uncharacterized Rmd1/YagE family protein
LSEELSYIIVDNPSLQIHDDCIKLPNDDYEIKLALSQAIAQSTELSFFEKKIEKTIETTQNIPVNLAKTGKIHLKNTEISKMRGALFITKSALNLHYDLLDEPEFFWEYPEHIQYYNNISDYLGIQKRIDIVNKRLEIINEIFDMLAEEQKHHHSLMLEWIVIGLIMFEVCMSIYHEIQNFF